MRGDGIESGNPSGGLPQPNPLLLKTSRKTNATLVYLSPAEERAAKNLQNFFPLPRLPEEEALDPEEEADDESLLDNCLNGWWPWH